jgi:hypothetical protein
MWLGLGWTFSAITLIAAVLAQFYRWSSGFILTGRRIALKNGCFGGGPPGAFCGTFNPYGSSFRS